MSAAISLGSCRKAQPKLKLHNNFILDRKRRIGVAAQTLRTASRGPALD